MRTLAEFSLDGLGVMSLYALILTTSLPHLKSTGAELASMNFIEGLTSVGVQCDVLGYLRHGDDPPVNPQFFNARNWHIEIERANVRPLFWLAEAFITRRSFLATKFRTSAFRRKLKDLLSKNNYDFVVIDHTHMGWVLDEPNLPLKRIFIAHNLEWKLYRDMSKGVFANQPLRASIYKNEAFKIKALERRLVNETNQTWTVTEDEVPAFNAFSEMDVGTAFDLPGLGFSSDGSLLKIERDIGILGAWSWETNRVGLEWFMNSVVPHLPPDLNIGIAGNGADRVPNSFKNVSYYGYVDNAEVFLRESRLIVVPTIAGAGVQLKTITAISAGVPILTTPLGIRGISYTPDFLEVCEASGEAFAQKIMEKLSLNDRADVQQGQDWYDKRRMKFKSSLAVSLSELMG